MKKLLVLLLVASSAQLTAMSGPKMRDVRFVVGIIADWRYIPGDGQIFVKLDITRHGDFRPITLYDGLITKPHHGAGYESTLKISVYDELERLNTDIRDVNSFALSYVVNGVKANIPINAGQINKEAFELTVDIAGTRRR